MTLAVLRKMVGLMRGALHGRALVCTRGSGCCRSGSFPGCSGVVCSAPEAAMQHTASGVALAVLSSAAWLCGPPIGLR